MVRRPVLLLLLVLVAASAWLLDQVSREAPGPRPGAARRPDYTLEAFERSRMGVDGVLRERLRGSLLVHFEGNGGTELLAPQLEIYTDDGRVWHLRSERAWIAANDDAIILYGPVDAWRPDGLGGRELEFQTRDLRLLRSERYAESFHPTRARDLRTETRGTGMRANLRDDRIEFLEDVRTRHDTRTDD